MDNAKISGVELENVEWRNHLGVGVNVYKKVIGNLAYREMLFYKNALTTIAYCGL